MVAADVEAVVIDRILENIEAPLLNGRDASFVSASLLKRDFESLQALFTNLALPDFASSALD